MKQSLRIVLLSLFTLNAFAGYYGGGGRSGYSGGRSYSSVRSYSSARITTSRPTYTRTYVSPRSSYTTVHHNYYSHPGYGMGFGGGGFFNGFLGGYLGGMMSGHSYAAPVAAAMLPQGQGMMMESGQVVAVAPNMGHDLLVFLVAAFIALGIIWLIVRIWSEFQTTHHSRW